MLVSCCFIDIGEFFFTVEVFVLSDLILISIFPFHAPFSFLSSWLLNGRDQVSTAICKDNII